MAVLKEVPGIKVTVRIDGVDCTEYDDPEAAEQKSEKPTSSKYIESPDNAKFTIFVAVNTKYKWGYKNHALSFKAYVDSEWVTAPIIEEDDPLTNGQHEVLIEGMEIFSKDTGTWSIRGLKFSTVKTIDEATNERIEKDRDASEKLGVIEVEVRRGVLLGPLSDDDEYSDFQPRETSLELSERSLKGKSISHGTEFSSSQPTSVPNLFSIEPLPEDDGCIATFRFKYRSRKALQQELIIPSTPPPPSPTFDRLSEAELHRLARERYEQINEEKHIKKEASIIKREFGDVFDLTGDDDDLDRPPKVRRVSEVLDLTDE
ncbi:hypothetical protein F5Y06DRAFT_206707 [Hypoxylon sp. FL0890]|nr:hypothetical protein F5Y06DRAFT_206707 [Hypoxylon sp. FL0890]